MTNSKFAVLTIASLLCIGVATACTDNTQAVDNSSITLIDVANVAQQSGIPANNECLTMAVLTLNGRYNEVSEEMDLTVGKCSRLVVKSFINK